VPIHVRALARGCTAPFPRDRFVSSDALCAHYAPNPVYRLCRLKELASTAGLKRNSGRTAEPLSAQAYGLLAATWSIVHGFAHLTLDGQLRAEQGRAATDAILSTLLPRMLEHLPWTLDAAH
jgi:hypothetical protein